MRITFAAALILGCTDKETEETPESTEETVEYAEPTFRPIADDGMSVESLDPVRYLGLWYEIATVPTGPQRNCTGTTAEYGIIDDETVSVRNRCYLYDLDGQQSLINGTATFIDNSYTRLSVDLGFGFGAPYLVTELDGSEGEEPYSFAAVVSGSTLWVLAREPQLDEDIYEEIVARLEERGYPVENLELTMQPAE